MPPLRFDWHPAARAFAGHKEVEPSTILEGRHIPTQPLSCALRKISGALANHAPFCVSDRDVAEISALSFDQFATLTGGTSGSPKIIARSQSSWISSFHANATLFDYTQNDSIAVLGALSHSLALYGVLEALHLGLASHVLAALKPATQLSQMRLHACSVLYATPTQLRLLPSDQPLTEVRLILCGGGTLDRATHKHITQLCPNATLHVFYGAAETSFVTLSDAATPEGSVGRAYPGVEIDVRDQDETGNGTIWVKSPYLFEGYLSGDSLHTQREGQWLTVGEQGRLDANGNMFLRGRAGRSVNVADETVYLDLLEAQINAAPELPPCVLLVRSDRMRGHVVVAVMEGEDDADLMKRLTHHCKANDLHIPREISLLTQLPQLPSGKPDMRRIAKMIGAVN